MRDCRCSADLGCQFCDEVLLKYFEGLVWQSPIFVCRACLFLVVDKLIGVSSVEVA